MKKAMIGITSYRLYNGHTPYRSIVNLAYVQAIFKAGGLPVVLPIGIKTEDFENLASGLDGILFTGGGDLNPALFGEKMRYEVGGIDNSRDEMEIALVKYVIRQQMPFLAICRGIEVLNVALGGTLYTHIADQLPDALHHPCYPDLPRNLIAHYVAVEKDSRLLEIFGSQTVGVNSLHHQGVKDVAPGLKVSACASDKLVEAVELPDFPFGIGVQWHPEELPESLPMQNLFKAFVKAAENN